MTLSSPLAACATTVPTGGGDDLFIASSSAIESWVFNGTNLTLGPNTSLTTSPGGLANVPDVNGVVTYFAGMGLTRHAWNAAGMPTPLGSVSTSGVWRNVRSSANQLVGLGDGTSNYTLFAARVDGGQLLAEGRVHQDSDNMPFMLGGPARSMRFGPLRIQTGDTQPALIIADGVTVRVMATYQPPDGGVLRIGTQRTFGNDPMVTNVAIGNFDGLLGNDLVIGSTAAPGITFVRGQ